MRRVKLINGRRWLQFSAINNESQRTLRLSGTGGGRPLPKRIYFRNQRFCCPTTTIPIGFRFPVITVVMSGGGMAPIKKSNSNDLSLLIPFKFNVASNGHNCLLHELCSVYHLAAIVSDYATVVIWPNQPAASTLLESRVLNRRLRYVVGALINRCCKFPQRWGPLHLQQELIWSIL